MVLLMMRFWTGMRVGEIARLKVDDEVDARGTVQQETRLAAAQTKDNYARTVFLPEKLRIKFPQDLGALSTKDRKQAFFPTTGGKLFISNVLTQHFLGCTEKRVSVARVATAVDAASSPTSSAKVLVFEYWHRWQDIAAFLSLDSTSMSITT